jgi:hypothetical protein
MRGHVACACALKMVKSALASAMISKELEEKIIAKERKILAAQKRRDFEIVAAALAPGFLEIGGSGQMFTKTQVLDRLKFVHLLDYSLERFRLVSVDATCVVLTYVATVKRRSKGEEYSTRSYRSSTWVERNGEWRVIFHQATPLPDSERIALEL